ncbi:HEAT repeat-containing protein 3 [Takifugu flavidus]|uniref:HEAT repeat-containing protein 3 n=1 Tax=Takifugu flavidus TaxID=433684 RepID=A0A5C6NJX6_9TELE|nr:HEAT repeat-containing protein 3 [Takifugu flavidus]
MGKSKTTKFKRPHFSVGLPVNDVKEVDAEECDNDGPAAELLEKLQSPSPDVRELACANISRVVQQSQTIPGFLQRDAVRRLGPMLLDNSLAVRETAAGALRNLSACGGQEVCEDMVKHDVMTPLTALLRECCAGFESAEPMNEQKNAVENVANEAVNLLWNLCESSSQALSVFNKANLLDLVVQCLERHSKNVELAISAAHCLHTVTDDNPELLRSLNATVLGVLENTLLSSQQSMAHTLLRSLAAGTLWNMKGSLPAARQAQTLNAVVSTLSQCLDLDPGELIIELKQAEESRRTNRAAPAGLEEQCLGEHPEEEMGDEEEAKLKKNERVMMADNDFSDLLPGDKEELGEATALLMAQQTSLEIIVNMCCSDDPSDDEWEEQSSSDESDMGPDGLCDGVSSLMSPLCLSAEIHGALTSHNIPEKANSPLSFIIIVIIEYFCFLFKVLKKTDFPRKEAIDMCHQSPSWKSLIKKMQRVQSRALTCLHSIVSAMDTDSLGGAATLQAAAHHLSTLVFGTAEIPKEEFLEAVISAMRSVLQQLASKNIPQDERSAATAVAEAKTRAWEEFGEAVGNDFRTASKRFWTTIRRLRKGKQCTVNAVYSGDGVLLTSTRDVVDRWKEYFEDLLNPTNGPSNEEAGPRDLGIGSHISGAEVAEVVKKLLGGKAPGVDEIRLEFLKALDVVGLSWLTRLCNIAWTSGAVPLDWQTGVVVPLFKKGDRRACSNYRGITLLSLPGKVYSGVLERRVRRIVEPRIQEEQCGFRPGRGTVDQLYTLSRVFEGAWEFAQPVHMCFVDLEKAFDRVPRGVLWGVLREYGVSGPLMRAICSLYDQCQSLVRIAGNDAVLLASSARDL